MLLLRMIRLQTFVSCYNELCLIESICLLTVPGHRTIYRTKSLMTEMKRMTLCVKQTIRACVSSSPKWHIGMYFMQSRKSFPKVLVLCVNGVRWGIIILIFLNWWVSHEDRYSGLSSSKAPHCTEWTEAYWIKTIYLSDKIKYFALDSEKVYVMLMQQMFPWNHRPCCHFLKFL